MQNARDTFYITLRTRLETLNPARVVTLRGVKRPGIFVEDAEPPRPQPLLDSFALRWTELQSDQQLPAILTRMTCDLRYATAGSRENAGLDRGRALEQMDAELMRILYPYSALKMNYAQNPAAAMGTMVFWSEPEFGPVLAECDRLSRTAKVVVFAFEEQGEE